MGVKTKQDTSWPLFVSIDLDTYRNEIMAVIHNDILSEASNILSFLPVFLETRLGGQIWQLLSLAYRAGMSSFSWDENAQRVVSMDGSKNDSDSPSSENTSKPLAAWETVDDDEADKSQAAHTIDLSTLFNFAPRNGNSSGSGYDDQILLTSFATGTSKLTMNIGSFQDPIFQENEDDVVEDDDTAMILPPVARIPASSPGAASSMSALTSDPLQSIPGNTDSVSSAPPSIRLTPPPPAAARGEVAPLAASAASLQKTGVDHANG